MDQNFLNCRRGSAELIDTVVHGLSSPIREDEPLPDISGLLMALLMVTAFSYTHVRV